MTHILRTRWAAIGAAVAVTLGAGGLFTANAAQTDGNLPVYVALPSPCRLVDTRAASTVGSKNTPIQAGEANAYTVTVRGSNGNCTNPPIPNDAVGVAVNLTATDPTTKSHFRVYPADVAEVPTTSNLNFDVGRTPIANKVDVGLSADGKITIFNAAGSANALVDVFGYYVDHNHSSADITNEAGITTAVSNPAFNSIDGTETVVSTTMRVPSNGYVVVQASGTVWHLGNGSNDRIDCQLQKGAQTNIPSPLFANAPWFSSSDAGSPDAINFSNISMHRTFEVSAADNGISFLTGQVFRLVCTDFEGDVDVQYANITATFYPTTYNPITLTPF